LIGEKGGTTVPVIPKPASTVVLIDNMSRVYLTKRPMTMKFLGGFYVFPGGSVEVEDNLVENEYVKNLDPNESFNNAHYVAAARELFEEVGVLLCCKDDGLFVELEREIEMEYRRLLVKGEISFFQLLKQEGLHLNLQCLKYFGHRITPEERPFRFDTRFFLAKLPKGQSPKPDLNEIDEAFWITPEEAITANENGKMSMANPTISSLRTIMNYQKGHPLMMPERQR
jgi:8-oxo-dGTP pyrophosphatase MutT (NUDIX family)